MIFNVIQVCLRIDHAALAKLPLVSQGDPGGVLAARPGFGVTFSGVIVIIGRAQEELTNL